MKKLHTIFTSILIISISILNSSLIYATKVHAQELPTHSFIETFDESRRYLAIDPNVTNRDLTTATHVLEKASFEMESSPNNELFHKISLPLPNGTILSYASSEPTGDLFAFISLDGLTYTAVINEGTGMPYPLTLNDSDFDPAASNNYAQRITSAIYDNNDTDEILDDEIHIIYRISGTKKDIRLASSPVYNSDETLNASTFTYQSIVVPFPVPNQGFSVPEDKLLGRIGGHGLDAANMIVRDTNRSNSPLGNQGFRPFTRDMRNTAVYYNTSHPDYYEGYERATGNGTWCPNPSNSIYCYGYFGMARRGVGTSGTSVSLDNISESASWSTIYSSNDPWTIVADSLVSESTLYTPTADPDIYYPIIQHYYNNLVGMNVMFRNKDRSSSTWTLARNETRADALYPTWTFSPGGDSEWIYPSKYESIVDPSYFEDLQGEQALTDTNDFGGQIYTQNFTLDKINHKLLAHVIYNPYTHDAAHSGHSDYLDRFESYVFSFREDGFMSYSDDATSGYSTWTTQPVTVPADSVDNELGLHISADVFEGGSLTVNAFSADADGGLIPVLNLNALTLSAGSYYIGDIIDLWEDSSNVLDGLAGEDIVLVYTLDNAKIYAFAFGEPGDITVTPPEPEATCNPAFTLTPNTYRAHTRASNGGFGDEAVTILGELIDYNGLQFAFNEPIALDSTLTENSPGATGNEAITISHEDGRLYISSNSLPSGSFDHELVAVISLEDAVFNLDSFQDINLNTGYSNQYAFYNDYVAVSPDGKSLELGLHWKNGTDRFSIDILEGIITNDTCIIPEVSPETHSVQDISLSQDVIVTTYNNFDEIAEYTLTIENEGDVDITTFSVAFSGYGNQVNGVGHTSSYGDGVCREQNNVVTCDFVGALHPGESEGIVFYFDTSSLNIGENITTYAEIIEFTPGNDVDSTPGNNSSDEDDDAEITFVK